MSAKEELIAAALRLAALAERNTDAAVASEIRNYFED